MKERTFVSTPALSASVLPPEPVHASLPPIPTCPPNPVHVSLNRRRQVVVHNGPHALEVDPPGDPELLILASAALPSLPAPRLLFAQESFPVAPALLARRGRSRTSGGAVVCSSVDVICTRGEREIKMLQIGAAGPRILQASLPLEAHLCSVYAPTLHQPHTFLAPPTHTRLWLLGNRKGLC